MRATGLVAGRELALLVESPIPLVAAVAFLLLANTLFLNEFFLAGTADLDALFAPMPLLLVVFVPALTMRSWAEERRQGSLESTVTLPLRTGSLVVGKFLAGLALFSLVLLGTLPAALLPVFVGEPDPGPMVGGFVGTFLLGAELLAVGSLASTLTRDQVVAFLAAALVGGGLVLVGDPRAAAVLDGLAPGLAPGTLLAEGVSPVPFVRALEGGLFELGALLHLVGWTAIPLALAARALDGVER